ncbi:MAG: Gfo/Idh/MocA family oxidoreductase [Verrucomicrobia bacterium]|nr:Gfo/Idh/MocA family oxidoreductase [Verrucomicrobiota bacterium]
MNTPASASVSSRRQFLRTSAAAAGVMALGPLDIARTAHAAGSDVLRVGMIGCGGRNSGAAVQALTADRGARLVAMHDVFLDRIQEKREAIRREKGAQVDVPDDRCFPGVNGYRQVIEASDVVLIANAAKFHPFHSMAAVQAGRHVFVEKPHGIDPAGLKLMDQACALAKAKGLSIVSGLHSRYHPGYAETVRQIHDGAIGDVIAMEENFLRAPYGVVDRKPGLSELEWQFSTQYHFRWLSGDDVVQSLVHNLDRASWVMHNQVPVKCHGLGGRSSMTDPMYGDVFDHHSVVYEFENGVRVYAFCRTTTGCFDEASSIILGSKGKASILACRIWGETNWRWQGQGDPYQIEHDRLFAAIRSGTPLNNGDYMTRSTAFAVMGQLSCYTGREVTWDDLEKSTYHHPPRPEECHDGMEPPVKPGPDGSYPVPIPGRTEMI